MNSKHVTRSSNNGMIDVDNDQARVGARHMDSCLSQWGGRYLDICTTSEISEKNSLDPRLDELEDARIGGFWLSLAREIGFDAFIIVWNTLSNRAANGDDGQRVYVPRYDAFIRYQRNRLIISLANNGLKAKAIREHVYTELNEHISTEHINKLIRQNARK
jgi:hypothetical protein